MTNTQELTKYDNEQNYYIKKGSNERKVTHNEFMEKFNQLRKREKELNKTIFHSIVDYTDSYIIIK